MTDVEIVRSSEAPQLGALLAAYHLRTEAEKDAAVADVSGLPSRYRAEVLDPRTAFADDTVLLAMIGVTAAGCVVLTAPVGGQTEIKRLWTDPTHRGRGVASALVEAALAESGVHTVRLTVWKWRTDAIALYRRFGFATTMSWDDRPDMVCMELPRRSP